MHTCLRTVVWGDGGGVARHQLAKRQALPGSAAAGCTHGTQCEHTGASRANARGARPNGRSTSSQRSECAVAVTQNKAEWPQV